MTDQPGTSLTAKTWQMITVLAVIPSAIHTLIFALVMIGISGPAYWISQNIFAGPWAVPCLWLFTIGGPLFSIIMGLTLEAWHVRTPLVARVSGGFAWTLLIFGCFSSLPAAYILLMD